MPVAPDTYLTLSAMITPALFMTASGSLIISTSNRMSRVVDRIRQLNLEADALCRGVMELDFIDDRIDHATVQLDRMMTRSDLIRHALTLLYLAMATFVGTSLTMAVDALVGDYLVYLEAVPTTMAIVGVGLMLAACVQLTREARLALRNNRLEISFYQRLRDRRGCPPAPESPTPGG